jgi:hypothetical protein
MAEKARAGKLDPDDVMGSTFTITNPGPYGSFLSAPIINVPNTGILSTETVVKRPAVVTGADGEDVIAIRHIGYLGLTWDHRAFDGSAAVLFLRRIKENLETWDWEQEAGVTLCPPAESGGWVGCRDEEAWDLQRPIHEGRVRAAPVDDYLLLLEHPHVYTVGRNGRRLEPAARASPRGSALAVSVGRRDPPRRPGR